MSNLETPVSISELSKQITWNMIPPCEQIYRDRKERVRKMDRAEAYNTGAVETHSSDTHRKRYRTDPIPWGTRQ